MTPSEASCPISVVIPLYKGEKYILETIDSVLKQKLLPQEIILVDDGGPDRSAAVVDEFISARAQTIPMLKLLRQTNGGPAKARNTGIRAAQGKYIAFLDQDDLWDSEKLRRSWEILSGLSEDYVGLYGRSQSIYPDGHVEIGPFDGYEDAFYEKLLRKGNFIGASGVIVKKNAIERAGFFDESRSLIAVEDYDLWLRLAAIGKFYSLDEVLHTYRTTVGYSALNAKRHFSLLANVTFKHFKNPYQKIDLSLRITLLYRVFRLRMKAHAF